MDQIKYNYDHNMQNIVKDENPYKEMLDNSQYENKNFRELLTQPK